MSTDPTWVPGAAGSGYGSDHLPWGRFRDSDGRVRIGVRIGGFALAADIALRGTPWVELAASGTLDPLFRSGPETWRAVRAHLESLVTDAARASELQAELISLGDTTPLLPIEIPDYVDFYASIDHAANVGRMFRPDTEPLQPNWRHLPVSYHGRSGTIVVNGTPIRRPSGQLRRPDGPTFAPSAALDIEAELGFVLGVPSAHGESIPVDDFAAHVFGVVGVNDWSARDIQAWEYVPLGPNLSKSFATSISTWITPLASLDAARVAPPRQDPPPLAHLTERDPLGYGVEVDIEINGQLVSTAPFATMYWSPAQMLAHLTSNGASVRTGDLYASGTISGPERKQRGSLLELSWNGTEPWMSPDGERTFLLDGDDVVLRPHAAGRYGTIAIGEVRATILAA